MHLSGQLKDWSINDLLQIMQVTRKTGSLDIESDKRGRIHFRDGAVTGAELKGSGTNYVGNNRGGIADVLYVLSAYTDGTFSMGEADGPDGNGWSVEDIVADVRALMSLEAEIAEAGLVEAAGVRLVQKIGSPIELNPAEWEMLVSLFQPVSFEHLESNLGRGAAVRILFVLHQLGVAEITTRRETEAAWLDQMAGGMTPAPAESPDLHSRPPEQPTWRESDGSDQPTWRESVPEEASPEPASETVPTAPPGSVPKTEEIRPVPEPVVAAAEGNGSADPGEEHPVGRSMLTEGVFDEIRRLRSKVTES